MTEQTLSNPKTPDDSQREVDSSAPICSAPLVLDVCCGSRAMWFDRKDPRAIYLDRRRETVTEILPTRNQTVVIDPDIVAEFTNIPFPDESFHLVVMDPPHVQREEPKGNITKRYGCLNGDWREMLRGGFAECFRVLKPGGTFIFKWSSVQFPLKDILKLTPEKPLFGHQSGKRMNTHWVAFIKQNDQVQRSTDPDNTVEFSEAATKDE